MYHWLGTQAQTPYATAALAVCSFLESLVLPPVAPLFILCCLESPKKSYWYAALTTVCSVLGGVVAFTIGALMWNTLGQQLVFKLITPQRFAQLVSHYRHYQASAVLIGSFTPMPYRLVGLTAGFCQLSLPSFILCSLLGRGARYFLVSAALLRWGISIKYAIDRWFYQLVVVFLLLLGGGLYLLHRA